MEKRKRKVELEKKVEERKNWDMNLLRRKGMNECRYMWIIEEEDNKILK